jgi:hypothetical protein
VLQLQPHEAAALLLKRREIRRDLISWSAQNLKIRTKSGAVMPLVLNRAQQFIHERLEQQKQETGRVRALILKGRQQGCSTYVGARFYHRATQESGKRVFILTHMDDATANLFEMVVRFHEHCPLSEKPSTGAASAKELIFDELDSGYKVGTAGAKGTGRSSTIQLFHGSEVGFWPHADTHAAGIMQAIPDEAGTESILESTANGLGNFFHESWSDAEQGKSDYIPIFVPWFWQDEYRMDVPEGFRLTQDESEYAKAYKLDNAQMLWRRTKITKLKDPLLFMQEYPANAAEAFQMAGHDGYIPASLVVRARKNAVVPHGPLIVGYDPAWKGSDRHAMAFRRGRHLEHVEYRSKLDTVAGAGWAKWVIDHHRPERLFIDVGGVGAGVYDQLAAMGYVDKGIVKAINFGSAPFESYPPDRGGPANRRAEMWMKSKQWLEDPAGVQIPDDDRLQADACAPNYGYNLNSELQLETKEHMRDIRKVKSPDGWDAVALTFAEPVYVPDRDEEEREALKRMEREKGRSLITGL